MVCWDACGRSGGSRAGAGRQRRSEQHWPVGRADFRGSRLTPAVGAEVSRRGSKLPPTGLAAGNCCKAHFRSAIRQAPLPRAVAHRRPLGGKGANVSDQRASSPEPVSSGSAAVVTSWIAAVPPCWARTSSGEVEALLAAHRRPWRLGHRGPMRLMRLLPTCRYGGRCGGHPMRQL